LSEDDREFITPESVSMVTQLGTAPRKAANLDFDMRLLSIIESSDKVPDTFHPRFYARVRYRVTVKKERFWFVVQDEMLHLPISINGRGRADILRAENAKHGIPVQPETVPDKPNILDRLTDNEKVHDYERWKERQEMGLE